MPGKQKKVGQFWQELKRRKVIKAVVMYAGAAFVIIELVNNVAEPLNIPDWTPRLLIIILIIGFPLTAVFSWIFDFTQEGLKKTVSLEPSEIQEDSNQEGRRKIKVSDVIITILAVAVCVLLYPRIFGKDKFENIRDKDGRISIAVLPFENHTGDTTMNYLQNGISSLIINGLGSSKELSVRDDHTMHEVLADVNKVYTAGISPSLAKKAATLARAETYISGSFQGTGDKYVILTNLVDTESGDLLWSHRAEGDLSSSAYLDLGNSLCDDIRDYLEIEALKTDVDYDFREAFTRSPEAYRYYIEGMNLILSDEYGLAIESLKRALGIDSTFTFAAFYIAWSYCYGEYLHDIGVWTGKAYEMRENLPRHYRYLVEMWHACFNLKDREQISKYCDLLSRSDNRSRLFWFDLGVTYGSMINEYEKSILAFEKVEEIDRERGQNWNYFPYYEYYIRSLHELGMYKKVQEISDQGLLVLPDHVWLTRKRLSNALLRADSSEIKEFSENIEGLRREQEWSEAYYESIFAHIYWGASQYVEAEKHAIRAHELEPENTQYSRELSWLQVLHDLNVAEGTRLILEVLEIEPDNIWILWIAGTGLRKSGKLEEALQLLGRKDDIDAGYMHEIEEEIKLINGILAHH